MSQGSDIRHVGIFQENRSGGFVSELLLIGGKYSWAAGSQQYTARNVKFFFLPVRSTVHYSTGNILTFLKGLQCI
jgi:hypothetical protein